MIISAFKGARRIVKRPAHVSVARKMFSTDISLEKYHKIGDQTLDQISDRLFPIEEQSKEDMDISLSQGVLTVNLGSKGTWVINKQTPNKQLWWSSPLSGPRRYEYDPEMGEDCENLIEVWKCTRDGTDMYSTLHKEILEATGIDIEKNISS